MNEHELYADDPTIHQTESGDWVHVPGHRLAKLLYLIFSLIVFLFGCWLLWEPLSRLFFGEKATARVVRIERFEPGKETKVIRFRQKIPEGEHETVFRYTVSVPTAEGASKEMQLGVGSRRNVIANINDKFPVIYFEEDDYVYGQFHHRTWAFGVSVCFLGLVTLLCAIPTYLAVGKPIIIDPEAEEEVTEASKEKEAEAKV